MCSSRILRRYTFKWLWQMKRLFPNKRVLNVKKKKKNTHKAPVLSQFQIKRHQAASPPSTASSGVSESRAQESFHMRMVRTQLQLGKLVSGVYGAMPHAPSSLLRGRPQGVRPPVSRG